jgi:hypothetical protein
MAKKKKKAVEVEVLDAEDKENTNLTGRTRLDVTLNKADIIDYFICEEEEELEASIKVVADSIPALTDELRSVEDKFVQAIKAKALEEQKKMVTNVKTALKKLHTCGFWKQLPTEVRVHSSNVNLEAVADRKPELVFSQSWNGRKQTYQADVGKKVPVSSFDPNRLDGSAWRTVNSTYSVNDRQHCRMYEEPLPHKFTECRVEVGGLTGDTTPIYWDDAIEALIGRRVELLNLRIEKMRELFELLKRHDDLPQLKKRIKKQVVGRVLKNTDDGKLLLKALKGIRKADTTKALTMDEQSG